MDVTGAAMICNYRRAGAVPARDGAVYADVVPLARNKKAARSVQRPGQQ